MVSPMARFTFGEARTFVLGDLHRTCRLLVRCSVREPTIDMKPGMGRMGFSSFRCFTAVDLPSGKLTNHGTSPFLPEGTFLQNLQWIYRNIRRASTEASHPWHDLRRRKAAQHDVNSNRRKASFDPNSSFGHHSILLLGFWVSV